MPPAKTPSYQRSSPAKGAQYSSRKDLASRLQDFRAAKEKAQPSPPTTPGEHISPAVLPKPASPFPTGAPAPVAKFEGSATFSRMVLVLQIAIIVTMCMLQKSTNTTLEPVLMEGDADGSLSLQKLYTTRDLADATLQLQLYNYYIGVALMMFIGFGYLMTFLRWYGLGAVGLTMMITCLGVETSMIVDALVACYTGHSSDVILDLSALLQANFAVAAFLISFGGLIGKVNPPQLVVMVVFESVFYGINKYIMNEYVGLNDVGGTVVIHMFGAYYGLVISWVLGVPAITTKEKSSYTSDLFSLLGTVVLWVYWPSFVAGATPAGTPDAQLQLVQTILSLAAATVTTFGLSSWLAEDGKLRPVDVQNATLAGGVTIGVLAGTPLSAGGALMVGSLAGALSTFGFVAVQPFLDSYIGLHDTCGIHNLHGMPSVLGGLLSVAIPSMFPEMSVFDPDVQLTGIGMTLGAAIVTGLFTGVFMKCFSDGAELGSDAYYWEVADDFDKVATVRTKDEGRYGLDPIMN